MFNFHSPFPSNFLLLTVIFCQAATETCKQPSQQNRGRISRQTVTENQLFVAGTKSGKNDFAKDLATLGVLNMHAAIMLSNLEMLTQPTLSIKVAHRAGKKWLTWQVLLGGAGPYIRTYRHFPILVNFFCFVLFFTITRMVLVSQQKHRYRTRYHLPFRA